MDYNYNYNKAHIFWDDVIETVVIRWHSFASGEEFRKPLDKLIEMAASRKAKKALFDNSHVLVLKDDMKWFTDEWLPRLLQSGIQFTATVNPKTSDTVNDVNPEATDIESTPFIHHEFHGVHSAVVWLSEVAV